MATATVDQSWMDSLELELQDRNRTIAELRQQLEATRAEREADRAKRQSDALRPQARPVIRCDDEDVATEFACEIAKVLERLIKLSPASDERGEWLEPQQDCFDVDLDVTACDVVPTGLLKGTVEGGGCSGEHRGKCRPCCAEWAYPFEAVLMRLEWINGKQVARWKVELK